jgi:fibronectin type 3 domain-containing protein
MHRTRILKVLLPVLVVGAFFGLWKYAQASVGANLTLAPVAVGTDDLVGATNAQWKFNVTTTAALVRGDVFQFTFPTPSMAVPFSLTNVSVSASSGIKLYSILGGTPLSNVLSNPSFESATTSWDYFAFGSSSFSVSTTASNGTGSVQGISLGTSTAQLRQAVSTTMNTRYTASYYARGVVGGEVSRLVLQDNSGACAGTSTAFYFNFVSQGWECASDFSLGVSTSPYTLNNITTNSFQRFTFTATSSPTSSSMVVQLFAGGDLAYSGQNVLYDAVQLEAGPAATTFNVGGPSPDTAGVGFGGAQGQVVYGYISTSTAMNTAFSITLAGITNATGQLSSLQNLTWQVKAGTLLSNLEPAGTLSSTKFTDTSTSTLSRVGAALVSDANSSITPSSYATSTASSYTFSITATSSIPSGGKVVVNFPAEYSLAGVTVNLSQQISNNTTTSIASFATSTGGNSNKVLLTTAGPATNAGDRITVVIGGITNPAAAGAYRSFSLYTTKANNGLLDGSYFGFEPNDYGNGAPPPVDTVHIGGRNNLVIQVYKQSGGSNVALSGSELTQVKIGVGCPDKGFFVGEKWLSPSSTVSYSNVLDCNYSIGAQPFNKGANSFYDTFLPPNFKQVTAVNGQKVTTSIIFGVPDATELVTIKGGVVGQTAFVNAYSADFQSFSPVFTDDTYLTPGFSATGTGYAKLKVKSGQNWSFNVGSGQLGSAANFSSGTTKYWPPEIPSVFISNTGTSTLPSVSYVQADKTLNVNLIDTSGNPLSNACVGVKRSGGGFFMGAQDTICAPNTGNTYQFKVPLGTIAIQVMRPGFGQPAEYPVAITAATTTKAIALSAPSNGIVVTVKDASNNPINGAPVFAQGSNGFGQSITGSTGTTTIYVPNGTYTVKGFAPGFGALTEQSVTISSGNGAVSFTVDASSLKTITGRVTTGGSGASGVQIGAHGVGATTGGNGTETDSNGSYTLYVPAGTYKVGGWSPGTGGFPEVSVDVTSANASGVNFALGGQGTLHLTITNASNVDPLFAGAFDSASGRGNGTNSWTTSGTSKIADISLPAGTYDVHVGSPATGEITSAATAVITAGGTTNKTYNAATNVTLVTLSGTVTSSAGFIANANVWASRLGGPGFYSTQTDASGAYSFKVADGFTYRVGVKINGYVTIGGDVEVMVSGTTAKNFSLSAAGSTISGTIKDTTTAGISGAWVSARKIVSSNEVWTGGPTDANGNYSLDVDSGTWTVFAEGPCFTRSTGAATTAGSSGVNVTLAATTGCSVPTPEVHGITAASGGQVTKPNISLDIPANALGTAQSTVSVSVATTSVVVSSPNATPLKKSVQSITATDSSGQSVTSLNSDVSLSITYDPNDLPNGFDESTLQLGYFDTNTGQWEPVASTVDTVNNKITAQVSHFTDYGPILPGVPSQITGLSATAASDSQISLSWTADSGATYYVVYRSADGSSYSSIATTTATTYSSTGLSASTLYYYKVSGYNSNGEGTQSSASSATTNAASNGSSSGSGVTNGGGAGGGPAWSITPSNQVVTSTTRATTTATVSSSLPSVPVVVPVVLPLSPEPVVVEIKESVGIAVSHPDSLVVITPPAQAVYKPGAVVKVSYQYQNSTSKRQKTKLYRQLLNAKGKVVQSFPGSLDLKPGELFIKNVNQPLTGNLAVGSYTIRIRVLDSRGKQVLAENSFAITVEKPVLKVKAKPVLKVKAKPVVKGKK